MSALICGPLILAAEVNLVQNPGFEEGTTDPAHWDRCDNLTTFWVKDALRGGKCIHLNSRIHVDDWNKRQEEMKLPHPPPPTPPRPIKGIGYDTVGGNNGVSYWSDWIECQPGVRYTLSADVRSEGGKPKVFVKGYSELPVELEENGKAVKTTRRAVTFKVFVDCDGGPAWQTSEITFCPTHDRADVKWMRIMLYAYWPAENYWFDNIRLVEAGKDPDAPGRWAAKKDNAEKDALNDDARLVRQAQKTIALVRKNIERYKTDVGAYPRALKDLLEDPGLPNWAGPYGLPLADDPWNHPYQYKVSKDGYSLKSLGPDGGKDAIE